MSNMRALAPLLLATLALAMTSALAYADAGPKHNRSAVDAAQVVSAAESYADTHGGSDSHGDLVSSVARNWDDFVDGLGPAYEDVKKGQIMRVIAHSDLGKGNRGEDDDEDDTPTTPSTLAASYSSNPPTSWSVGQTQTYSIAITNTGSQAWNASGANPVRLGVSFGTSDDTPGVGWATDQRLPLPNDVASGASVTLSINVTAPSVAGSYVLRHRALKEGLAWFDQLQKTSVNVTVAPTITTSSTAAPSTDRPGNRGNGRGRGHDK